MPLTCRLAEPTLRAILGRAGITLRVTIVFKSGKKTLTGELRGETDTTYEVRYIDRDMKFRHASVPKSEVKELLPVIRGLFSS